MRSQIRLPIGPGGGRRAWRYTAGPFFDLSKAFDKIGLQFILKNVCNLDIRDLTLKWIESFLTLRPAVVRLECSASGVGSPDLSHVEAVSDKLIVIVILRTIQQSLCLEKRKTSSLKK